MCDPNNLIFQSFLWDLKRQEEKLCLYSVCSSAALAQFFWTYFMIIPRAFKSFALFNTVKLLSAYFRIHKAPISLPGTSLALQLSHLNVFNHHRIASYWNDMQNLICCAALPLVFSLSGADGKRTEFMSERNGKPECWLLSFSTLGDLKVSRLKGNGKQFI